MNKSITGNPRGTDSCARRNVEGVNMRQRGSAGRQQILYNPKGKEIGTAPGKGSGHLVVFRRRMRGWEEGSVADRHGLMNQGKKKAVKVRASTSQLQTSLGTSQGGRRSRAAIALARNGPRNYAPK